MDIVCILICRSCDGWHIFLQMCSNNLNQYTKAANENGQVYSADLEDLRARLDELISISKQILSQLSNL